MARYEIKRKGEKEFTQYTSPSEILGQLEKGFHFYNWIAELCVKENDKTAWTKKRDATADIGLEFHGLVETYINIKIKEQMPDMRMLLKDYNVNIKQMFYQFLLFEKNNVKKFLESEKPVVHEELCCAGTADFVFLDKENKICLCDLKTKNGIYGKEPAMQVSFYASARTTMSGDYEVKFKQDGQSWVKTFSYEPMFIHYTAILCIYRDFFNMDFIPVKEKDAPYLLQGFLRLLDYFYIISARKLNNKRAKKRQ